MRSTSEYDHVIFQRNSSAAGSTSLEGSQRTGRLGTQSTQPNLIQQALISKKVYNTSPNFFLKFAAKSPNPCSPAHAMGVHDLLPVIVKLSQHFVHPAAEALHQIAIWEWPFCIAHRICTDWQIGSHIVKGWVGPSCLLGRVPGCAAVAYLAICTPFYPLQCYNTLEPLCNKA